MDTLLNDVRYAVRTMLRAPGWTLMAVVTLALGTGANTAVFGFVDALLFRPAPGVRDPGRVVAVFTSDYSSGPYGNTSYPDFQSIAASVTAFDKTAAEDDGGIATMRSGDDLQRVRVSRVSGEYFDVLGLTPGAGRTISTADTAIGADVAVVSEDLWRRVLQASPSAVGSTIKLNDQTLTIVGIAPEGFRGLGLGRAIDVWTPLVAPSAAAEERQNRGFDVVARLKPGGTLAQAREELTALASRLAREFPATNLGTLDRPAEPRPMTATPAWRIGPSFRGDVVALAAVLMGGVGLVLVLACANVASLLLSRATSRGREIAVRRALGASSRRLLRQLLTETAVLAFASAGAGLLIAAWTTDLLPSFLPPEQAQLLDASVGWRVVLYAIGIGALSSLLVGILPALRSIRPPLAAALRRHDGDIGDRAGSRLRGLLVSAQVGIACLLLVAAALLVQSVRHTLDADLGLGARNAVLASVELPAAWKPELGLAYYEEARARVAALPGVESAAWIRTLPLALSARRGFSAEGHTPAPGEDRELNVNLASPGYFETLGIPMRSGREFSREDAARGRPVVVVNETLARRFFGGDAVGKRLTDSSHTVLEIVGVAGDTKYLTVSDPVPPFVYYPLAQSYVSRMTLVARTSVPAEQLGEMVRRELRAANRDAAVFATRTLRAYVHQALATERLTASLVAVCGAVALLLAVVGLYGAVAYLVVTRMREIGVRIALGATPERVLLLVIGHGLWIAGAGIAAGLAAAAIGVRWVPLALYGVTPVDVRTYAGVVVVLMLTAALAAFVPARRAVSIDPARALAHD